MAKEISLEDLAASSTPQTNNTRVPTPGNSEKVTQNSVKMSAADVASHLTAAGKIKPKEEIITEPPLVENAFKAMNDTLRERKDWINNTMMPIVERNAEEMALENELGEGEDSTAQESPEVVSAAKTADVNDIPDIDDSDFDDEIEDDAVAVAPTATSFSNTSVSDDVRTGAPAEVRTEVVPKPKHEPKKASAAVDGESGDLDDLLKDLEAEDSMNVVDDEEETPEELRARFKESLNNVKIINDPIDFTKFKIRQHAVSSAKILSSIQSSRTVKKSDWALYHTGRCMTFTECSGPELDTLKKNINTANGVNGVIQSLRFVYDHTEDNNKPTFEAWTKLIRTEDIESLYYGIYRACYSDTNLVARACSAAGCNKTSLINTKIDDMVKFDSDEVEAKFKDIFSKDTTTETNTFESTLIQASDDIVISYSVPTLYSTFIQFATLKPEITNKYSDILNTMAYIDGFYTIDRATMELTPISINEYPTNINKTILAKLKVYTGILKSLTNDQYNVLIAKLNSLIQEPKVSYIYPKDVCPECGAELPEEPIESVLNLLFTRAQLAQIKSL